ncbi:unnamed protein product [Adineta ricciae]|uniref:Peptidase M12A domain-containing protein n=1 Tax=Adineta ricciae TaxID=249248 RepID=A0A815LP64_ADIRI|nr:unnamed protein product [Adineta ricciae]
MTVKQLPLIVLLFISLNNLDVLSLSTVTFDEFFNYTAFSSITLSPKIDQSILIQTTRHVWEENINEEHLYLFKLQDNSKTLITKQASSFQPRWKDNLIALILADSSTKPNQTNQSQYIHLYSLRTNEMIPISIGTEHVHTFIWSTTSMSLYFATRTPQSTDARSAHENEWKDVIDYREQHRGDTIYRADIENMTIVKIEPLVNISYSVHEMICSPDGRQLVYSTEPASSQMENMADNELYSLDLSKPSPLIPVRLTNNSAVERNLKWSADGSIFFTVISEGSVDGEYEEMQGRLYSLNPNNGRIQHWASQFTGEISSYVLLQGERQGVAFLGQLSTEVQIYHQQSIDAAVNKLMGWNGTYEKIVTFPGDNSSAIAFIHSSFEKPQEVYFVDRMDQLNVARQITNENQLFTERNLPKGKPYRWTNKDDGTEIEGILLYPPDKFEQKNLPLYVLIHGGPHGADVNTFQPDWYFCAPMIATEGWLVFEPNYRGSTGYGDEFLQGVRFQIVSRPARDILFGVDALIHDGIADPKRLTVGGYSYGAYLTNWIITQTTRFNAAVSGAGASEHVADWGLTDIPYTNVYMFGGYPWQVPHLYQAEAAILRMDKVRTPTLIIVPANDIRVAASENYILERGLHSRNVPSKMIILPGETHGIPNNPWHGKIKRGVARRGTAWTNGIVPYEFDSDIIPWLQELVISVMQKMERLTAIENVACVQFRPKLPNDQYYIQIVQELDCFPYESEQYRLLSTCSIIIANRHNFDKYNDTFVDTLNTSYDYSSIMHYERDAFSWNRLPTIEPLQANVTIGQRDNMSSTDIHEVQLLYNCSAIGVTLPEITTTTPQSQYSVNTTVLSAWTTNSRKYIRRSASTTHTYYEAYRVTVSINGCYIFTSSSQVDTYGYLYSDSFSPIDTRQNLIIENDDDGGNGQFQFETTLETNRTYILVATTYRENITGEYRLIISGLTSVNIILIDNASTTLVSSTTTNEYTITSSKNVLSCYDDELTTDLVIYNRENIFGTYYYNAIQINVPISDNYVLTSSSVVDTYGYLYMNSFNPQDMSSNLLAKDDNNGGNKQFSISYKLYSSITYILITTTYISNVTGNFRIEVRGPAEVTFSALKQSSSTTRPTSSPSPSCGESSC